MNDSQSMTISTKDLCLYLFRISDIGKENAIKQIRNIFSVVQFGSLDDRPSEYEIYIIIDFYVCKISKTVRKYIFSFLNNIKRSFYLINKEHWIFFFKTDTSRWDQVLLLIHNLLVSTCLWKNQRNILELESVFVALKNVMPKRCRAISLRRDHQLYGLL